ncbi:GNAT family N-acetyltransferase [Paenibacillus hexagrammi]|uniref:GNAT family N-acetyltransferase n=1 Tax=Paenibacillus hexagrammi TaxID=2908839 RepID=A0ABY3SKY6_9BACL|nr:GNAT family N-acetyltransferase [Paenibacillus sp. YPD9-1]UJF34190.1 GNAT family N-acetyltransferase [Paenibacillus sp. YPD9-1]
MLFRKAIVTDIPQLITFRKILLSSEDNSSMDETFSNYFETSLSDKSLVVWVADDDGVVVSTVCFCICRFAPRFDNPTGLVAYMTNVYTIPNYRRQGIVSKLVSEAKEELATLGVRKILLHSSDMAKPMYEKFGFVEGKNYMSINI